MSTRRAPRARPDRESFEIAGVRVEAGQSLDLDVFGARLPAGGDLTIPLRVLHGRRSGPVVFVSAAIHGDELNGLEITRRLLAETRPERLGGTLLVAPLLNVFGFLNRSRYLPDGRDLNRSFPGSNRGPLASRLAHAFFTEVVSRARVGIDLHTATRGRTNLPHIRADLDDPFTRDCAAAFGAPLTLHGKSLDGSLRAAGRKSNTAVLVYEGGEAQRFDESTIATGLRGVQQVLAHLGMLRKNVRSTWSTVSRQSAWVRAPRGGILRLTVRLGSSVSKGAVIGEVADALGRDPAPVRATVSGRVIGMLLDPSVHQGDALVHLALPESEPLRWSAPVSESRERRR